MKDRPLLWAGDSAFCPSCHTEVTSGMMGAMCPHRERCEFWPDDEDSQDFLDELGMRQPASEWPPLQPDALHAKQEGQPAHDGAEATRQDEKGNGND